MLYIIQRLEFEIGIVEVGFDWFYEKKKKMFCRRRPMMIDDGLLLIRTELFVKTFLSSSSHFAAGTGFRSVKSFLSKLEGTTKRTFKECSPYVPCGHNYLWLLLVVTQQVRNSKNSTRENYEYVRYLRALRYGKIELSSLLALYYREQDERLYVVVANHS